MTDRKLAEHRVRDLLLVALTVSTGAVDAITWLGLDKVFSAFMTGNIAFLGFRAAGAEGPPVPRVVAAIAAFAVGAALAGRVVAPARDSLCTWPHRVTVALGATLVAQIVFLAAWIGVGGQATNRTGDLLIAISSLAMGMQTTAIFSLGVRAVFTTAATATLAILMGDLSGWPASRAERRRLAAVVVGLFAGAVAGGLLVVHARSWAPVFPVVTTALVIAAAAISFPSRRLSSIALFKSLDAIHSER